jgi:DDE superfamily endonuclease
MVTHSKKITSVNIIAGVSNTGSLYYTINKGKTNSFSFLLFVMKLCYHLNEGNINWRKDTIIMLDNASYHRSNFVRQKLERFKIPIIYMGPYQFKMAPVELFFSYIKSKDLNPLKSKLTSR